MDKNKTLLHELPIPLMKKIRSIKEEGEIAILDPKHAKVLRLEEGEIVKALLTDGNFAKVQIIHENKAKIIEIIPPIQNRIEIYAIISLLKRREVELSIEFLSQLGVRKIIPIITKRVDFTPSPEKREKMRERFEKIAYENARISGVKPPEISEIINLESVPGILDKDDVKTRIVFWENSPHMFSFEKIKVENRKLAFLVGPEGGLDESEISFLKENNFSDFKIGEKIIKSEFFPIYICSALDIFFNA